MKRFLTMLVLALLATPAFAWPAKVVGVSDGDTIKVIHISEGEKKTQYKIRLYGIDAPESGQAFGKASKESLSEMVFGKTVDVQETDTDRYGRLVGLITVDDLEVNAEQIRKGFAWVYGNYCKRAECGTWKESEATARQEEVGLWADAEPMAPWDWRRGGALSSSAIKKEKKQILAAVTEEGDSSNSLDSDGSFVGNTKSKVFHEPGCRHYSCKNCSRSFSTKKEAMNSGYRPLRYMQAMKTC